ncbi:MAG: protein-disulfide reductase DsbD family protein [Acidocella sp.]|nr:protein-disulfide reductase DsbD family protein [Acidocella sp.]
MRALLALLLLLPHLAFAAASNVFTSPRDTVRLVSETNTAQNGQVHLALEFSLKPGWHIYWQNPGDAGFPPRLTPAPPAGFSAFTFPPPEYLLQAGVGAYVLSGHVVLPFTATGVGTDIAATASWLVCSDVCVPERAKFSLVLAGGSSAEQALFTPPSIVPSPFPATLAPAGALTVMGPGAAQVAAARFFPVTPGVLDNAAPQRLGFTATGFTLGLKLTGPAPAPLTGVLELTDHSGAMQALSLSATPGAAPAHLPYWLLALVGGLVLNLMPCVFPILAMKTFAFARLGGAAHGHIRREALGYAAGVLASMLALAMLLLALRAAGAGAFWGFQFQSPVFVALAGWIVLAAGLNLAGLFHLSAPGFIRHIPAQHSFLTGLLAVLVATPCTAPFMGTAIAAALALPALPALGIFAALGLGMALPILILAFIPQLAARLPRPGAWMLWLQRALALPMFATFAWLAWVLFRQSGGVGLALLLLGAALLAVALRRKPAAALAVLALLPFLHTAPAAPALTLPNAQPYTAERLATLRAANQPVFVDLTAAWCVTCLVNEATSLSAPEVQRAFAAHHAALLVGDWTDRNPAITALLAANHRAGVPLYLYYAPGAPAEVLPQLLTPRLVITTLNR